MDHWLKDYHAFSLKNPQVARRALNVRLVWEQPSMLRVPKSFDQIFQACIILLAISKLYSIESKAPKAMFGVTDDIMVHT